MNKLEPAAFCVVHRTWEMVYAVDPDPNNLDPDPNNLDPDPDVVFQGFWIQQVNNKN